MGGRSKTDQLFDKFYTFVSCKLSTVHVAWAQASYEYVPELISYLEWAGIEDLHTATKVPFM